MEISGKDRILGFFFLCYRTIFILTRLDGWRDRGHSSPQKSWSTSLPKDDRRKRLPCKRQTKVQLYSSNCETDKSRTRSRFLLQFCSYARNHWAGNTAVTATSTKAATSLFCSYSFFFASFGFRELVSFELRRSSEGPHKIQLFPSVVGEIRKCLIEYVSTRS